MLTKILNNLRKFKLFLRVLRYVLPGTIKVEMGRLYVCRDWPDTIVDFVAQVAPDASAADELHRLHRMVVEERDLRLRKLELEAVHLEEQLREILEKTIANLAEKE